MEHAKHGWTACCGLQERLQEEQHLRAAAETTCAQQKALLQDLQSEAAQLCPASMVHASDCCMFACQAMSAFCLLRPHQNVCYNVALSLAAHASAERQVSVIHAHASQGKCCLVCGIILVATIMQLLSLCEGYTDNFGYFCTNMMPLLTLIYASMTKSKLRYGL